MLTLKDRFEQFMLSTRGVESVDQLMKHCVVEGRQRADYLACDRRVVIEQKSIDINPDYKIQQFLDSLPVLADSLAPARWIGRSRNS